MPPKLVIVGAVCAVAAVGCGSGVVAADAGQVLPIGSPNGCAFDTTYRYGLVGGFGWAAETTLASPRRYEHKRSPLVEGEPGPACVLNLPFCNAFGLIDPGDILRDIAHSDVQGALAHSTPPFFGVDATASDGSVFYFERSDGHGFGSGFPCGDSGSACLAIPAGIERLAADLLALDEQQLMDPSCAALR